MIVTERRKGNPKWNPITQSSTSHWEQILPSLHLDFTPRESPHPPIFLSTTSSGFSKHKKVQKLPPKWVRARPQISRRPGTTPRPQGTGALGWRPSVISKKVGHLPNRAQWWWASDFAEPLRSAQKLATKLAVTLPPPRPLLGLFGCYKAREPNRTNGLPSHIAGVEELFGAQKTEALSSPCRCTRRNFTALETCCSAVRGCRAAAAAWSYFSQKLVIALSWDCCHREEGVSQGSFIFGVHQSLPPHRRHRRRSWDCCVLWEETRREDGNWPRSGVVCVQVGDQHLLELAASTCRKSIRDPATINNIGSPPSPLQVQTTQAHGQAQAYQQWTRPIRGKANQSGWFGSTWTKVL